MESTTPKCPSCGETLIPGHMPGVDWTKCRIDRTVTLNGGESTYLPSAHGESEIRYQPTDSDLEALGQEILQNQHRSTHHGNLFHVDCDLCRSEAPEGFGR